MKKITDPEWKGQLARFSIVGCMTALLYAALLYFLVSILKLHTGVGAAGAYLVSLMANYTGHYFWTYRTNRAHRSATKRYLVANAVLFLFNTGVMAVGPTLIGIHYAILQTGVIGVIAVSTFTLQRLWVFRRQN